jgi:PBSX family phage terminase large subunit
LGDPVGKQADSIIESDARINIWHGSVRSSKTITSLIRWLIFCANGPPGELLMVGKTERALKRNVLDVISQEVEVNQGIAEARIFGRRCYLSAANDSTSEAKIRGLTLVGAYGDEMVTWPKPYFSQLMQRLSVRGAKFFGTTNPDSPSHWLKKEWIDREGEIDLKAFHFTLMDNPYLDPLYIANLEKEFVGLWRRRFILGEWVLAAGAIYDMWDPDVQVVKAADVPLCSMHWLGVDYGTATVFAAVLFGLGVDNRVYAKAEYRWDARIKGRQKTDSEYSQDVRDWLEDLHIDPEFIYVDPSATSFITQLWRDQVRGVRPADNDVDDGIRLVARSLTNGRFRVVDQCAGLIAEFPSYVWDDKVQLRGEKDRPFKVDDHSLDATRYAIFNTAYLWEGLPILPVTPGGQ